MCALRKPQYKIGVWGPPTAGKTVYLWVYTYLLDHLRRLRDREWRIETDDETHEKLGQLRSRILNQEQNLPDSTSEGMKYHFTISGYGNFWLGRLRADVTFTDWPGEHLKEDKRDSEFYQELASCDAILCFIDPLLDPRNPFKKRNSNEIRGPDVDVVSEDSERWSFYQRKLDILFRYLIPPDTNRQHIQQVMAFLVTKVDHDRHLWDLRHRGEELLREIILDAGITLIENRCKTYRIFPCSSVGAVLSSTGMYKESNLESVNPSDNLNPKYRLREITNFERKPFNVIEPMTWVLERLKWQALWRR